MILHSTITRCKHVFHRACIGRLLKTVQQGGGAAAAAAASGSGSCPLCRAPIVESELLMAEPPSTASRSSDNDTDAAAAAAAADGSKTKALIAYIEQHRSASNDMALPTKFVVFSQFVKYLDLLAPALAAAGISCVRLDGTMNSARRKAALQSFREDASAIVMLISLKAGGVGLNLTTANHVVLMDPW